MFSQSRIHPGTILTSQCKLNYWAWSSKRQLVIAACGWRRAEHMEPIILQQSAQLLWNATLVGGSFNRVSNILQRSKSRANGLITCVTWGPVRQNVIKIAPCLCGNALMPSVWGFCVNIMESVHLPQQPGCESVARRQLNKDANVIGAPPRPRPP